MRLTAARILFITLGALGASAHVHPSHAMDTSWVQGMVHPLTGLDHLLAMVAIGLWAAQTGGAARLGLPLAFVASCGAGLWAGAGGWALPAANFAVLGSLLVLGILLASARSLPLVVSIMVAGLLGWIHGQAHGIDLTEISPRALHGAGFVIGTALLHIAGLGMGTLAVRHEQLRWLRWAGVGLVACCGALS